MRRDDAWKWTEEMLRNEHIERSGCNGVVRVGVLNRHVYHGRAMVNARDIMDELFRVFGDKVQVDEIYFDDKTFQEQIGWFASHDIVLTAHGAQETGLPFMPKCSALLEVFPFDYYVPEFFSALSDSTHVQHFLLNNDRSRDPVAETKKSAEKFEDEHKAKLTALCPATQNMLDNLLTAIRQWDSCCSAVATDSRQSPLLIN